MRVALLGGSFDPIHHGHLIVAMALREALGLDQIRLVPAGEQPFKTGHHRATAAQRADMVRLAVAGEPGLTIERAEVDRPGPSYTVETLRVLAAAEPGVGWSILLGADAARLFPTWRDPAGIKALAEVVVFARDGEAPPEGVADRVVAVPRVDVSSTEIRARVRAGRSIRFLVPDAVAGYIATHGLYRD
ncbi:MAG: nicotinate (nicotinamide) nucleotide adenylyltransferase [Gemmatimonadetes bacterium]|nr:nicotinate (nicotinamide) nucleotide adenylyltransferase [Gemmatimonadota bacterium]